jgi:hypothetical protein
MTNAEATDKAATVAEQGAHVAPVKASSKKGPSQKKGAPKGKKASGSDRGGVPAFVWPAGASCSRPASPSK